MAEPNPISEGVRQSSQQLASQDKTRQTASRQEQKTVMLSTSFRLPSKTRGQLEMLKSVIGLETGKVPSQSAILIQLIDEAYQKYKKKMPQIFPGDV